MHRVCAKESLPTPSNYPRSDESRVHVRLPSPTHRTRPAERMASSTSDPDMPVWGRFCTPGRAGSSPIADSTGTVHAKGADPKRVRPLWWSCWLLRGDDVDVEASGDLRVQLQRDLVAADRLDVAGQLEAAPVDVRTARGLDRRGDLGR